jgi:hypothetical protein
VDPDYSFKPIENVRTFGQLLSSPISLSESYALKGVMSSADGRCPFHLSVHSANRTSAILSVLS